MISGTTPLPAFVATLQRLGGGGIIYTISFTLPKETARVIQSIDAGIKDANEGRLYTIAKARHILKKHLHKKT